MRAPVCFAVAFLAVAAACATASGAHGRAAPDHYVAAIVEHAPISVPGLVTRSEAVSVVMQNLDVYEGHMRNASAQGAQLIVFPEDGLFGDDKCTREEIYPYLEFVPNNRLPSQRLFNPCEEQDSKVFEDAPALVRLSCLAKQYGMVVAADMGDIQPCSLSNDPFCPRDGRYQYNTLVAFDSDGALLKKYHKTHLFYEPQYDTPRHPAPVSFTTSFGVRFGMAVCFDLMFPLPPVDLVVEEGITDLIYSTWWINTPPSFSATQYQQAWSRALDVNLLAAGNGNAWLYSGSGIFSRGETLAEVFNIYYTPHDALRVAKVPLLSRASARAAPVVPALPSKPRARPLVRTSDVFDWRSAAELNFNVSQFQIHCPIPDDGDAAAGVPSSYAPTGVSWPEALRDAQQRGALRTRPDGSMTASSHTHGVLTLSAPFQMTAGKHVTASAAALHLTCKASLNASTVQPYIRNDSVAEWYVVFAFAGQYDNDTAFYREHFCATFRCWNETSCLYDLIFANTIFDGFELTANMPPGHTVFALTSTNNAALIPNEYVDTGLVRSGPSSALNYVRSDRGGTNQFNYILLNAALLARDMRNR